MNILFQNPVISWLAPLVAVPVLLHILTRAKPPRYLFAATDFVRRVMDRTIRIKRPKDRLLLLCRTLLVLTLLFIFLRPLLFMGGGVPDTDAPGNLVIVIDRSASMSWSEGGRSRFSAACDEASVLLDGLSSRDTANIVWMDREPEAVFPEMGSNTAFLKERLREARGSHEFGNAEQAIALACSQLTSRPGNRELCVISDFQSTQWESTSIQVPEDIVVSTLCPARETAENGAILSIRTEPVSPLAGETVQVIVSVGNYSSTPRNRTVIVTLDEKRITLQIQTPAWGRGSVVVDHVFSRHGLITVSARLDEDAFGADDWGAALVPVREALHVGLAGYDPGTTPVFERVINALPWMRAVPVDLAAVETPNTFDLMVVTGWNGESAGILQNIKESGIPLIVVPSPEIPGASLARLAGLSGGPYNGRVMLETLERPVGMIVSDQEHTAFSLFRDGLYGDPAQGSFRKRLVIDGSVTLGKPILSYADGKPALIECSGETSLLIWLPLLSAESGDWVSQSGFMPFAGEVMGSLKSKERISLPVSSEPGEILSFTSLSGFDRARLLDQSDTEFPVVRVDSEADGIRYVSEPVESPGIYRVCSRNDCTPVKVVNFPAVESDLRSGPPPVLSTKPSFGGGKAGDLQAKREGIDLWKMLIWALLAFIALESLLVFLLDRDDRAMAGGAP